MNNLSTGEWIAIVGITVAVIIGLIQILKNNASKSGKINPHQSQGAFSKGKQSIEIKVEQNDKS